MTTSNFPNSYDNNANLYRAVDGLRVVLAEDYNPGDTIITVYQDDEMMGLFPNSGIITLTEQCSDAELRALSFSYSNRTTTTFEGLTLLSGFTDNVKLKNITNVTQNVMAAHHNNLKDALIAIQGFCGRKGQIGTRPLIGTMEQRINYLRNKVLEPKAWFKANKTVGLAPLTVTFTDQSFRLGTDGTSQNISHIWDFGDNTMSVVPTISVSSIVPSNISNVIVEDVDGGTIIKTYTNPGIYTVKLTVINDFGSDTVEFNDMISARFPSPSFACIAFNVHPTQKITQVGIPSGGPYTTIPVIRSPINTIIDIAIPTDINGAPIENPNTPGVSYGGETLNGLGNAIDPINYFTWSLGDDIPHNNSSAARAVYSVGGIYDLILRCDTQYGSYRITTYENSIDVVEKYNLWLWMYNTAETEVGACEFGLISETFKSVGPMVSLNKNDEFLTGETNEAQQKREFHRNVGFTPRTATSSGNSGTCLMYWASGRAAIDSPALEVIRSTQYNAFTQIFSNGFSDIYRPWNWVSMASSSKIYFILGTVSTAIPAGTSPTNQNKDQVALSTLNITSPVEVLGPTNYKNGAVELQKNATFDGVGNIVMGQMSVYRSTWHGDSGYFMRNEGTGNFFRIKSFYKTSGNTAEPFVDIRKLTDMAGSARIEGQLVSLSQGVYFFSNSGAVAAYSPTTGLWSTGGPGVNSPAFRNLQDTSVLGFDSASQTLLAASDNDKIAYISFDYSNKSFIRFNETDTTFSSVTNRPSGKQWNMAIF